MMVRPPRRLTDPRPIVVRTQSYDFIDVLERALTKGVVFELEDDVKATAVDRGVFKIRTGMSWRYFFEAEEEDRE